ncbi:hypothetical protein ACOME3_007782 [Neoechinorhynchus agilis]
MLLENQTQGSSFLQWAKDGDIESLIAAIETKQSPIDSEIADEAGQTPLIIAAQNGHNKIVRTLIDHGSNVDEHDLDGWNALLNAAKEGFMDICKTIVNAKCNLEATDCGGFTALMWAVYKNRVDIVDYLCSVGANVNHRDKNGMCSLAWACGRGFVQIVDILLSRNVDVDALDKSNTSSLIWSSRRGYTDIVTKLLARGANADIIGMKNWTALIAACKNKHEECAIKLIEACGFPTTLNRLDKDGNSALFYAARNGLRLVVEMLVDRNVYINRFNKNRETALLAAVKAGKSQCVNTIMATQSVDLNLRDEEDRDVLWWAVERGNRQVIETIITYLPKNEAKSKVLNRALLVAVSKNRRAMVNQLINHGAIANENDDVSAFWLMRRV